MIAAAEISKNWKIATSRVRIDRSPWNCTQFAP